MRRWMVGIGSELPSFLSLFLMLLSGTADNSFGPLRVLVYLLLLAHNLEK